MRMVKLLVNSAVLVLIVIRALYQVTELLLGKDALQWAQNYYINPVIAYKIFIRNHHSGLFKI